MQLKSHVKHWGFHQALARRDAHSQPLASPAARPSPVDLPPPTRIMARGTSTSTCTDTSSPGCELPTDATISTGAIIGISVAIPLVLAFGILLFLHRRNQKKQAAEDARDAQADLDFGIDPASKAAGKGRKGKKGPEMTVTDMGLANELRKGGHGSGMSIDLGNPYILPAEVNGSHTSLHSLSRTVSDNQDPYRMVGQPSSIHGGRFDDASSSRAGSERALLTDAQPNPMSRTHSPLAPVARKGVPTSTQQSAGSPSDLPKFDFGADAGAPAQNGHSQQKSIDTGRANRFSNPDKSLPNTPHDGLQTPPPRGDSKSPYLATNNQGPVDPYSFQEIVVPPSPERESYGNRHVQPEHGYTAETFPHPPPPEPTNANRMTLGLGLNMPGNRLSVMRPLPPDAEDSEENPEQRANRIRSFYKEYFSEGDTRVHNAGGAEYYEDYGEEFLGDGTVFDPDSGQFIVAQAPYAEPVTRRAMTPPPRGPPRKFQGGPGGPHRPGHMSNSSSPGIGGPGPRGRAFSTASTPRMGLAPAGARGRPAKRPLPPPSSLRNLPTPHLLKEGAFDMTIDFAPPSTVRDRAMGRSESPFMDERPYSPAVPVASPLASSFTELNPMPSPHLLRKSGTFTALDFVPPPRLRDPDAASDAGSIRSGRSNFSVSSARQQANIRNGAYRLSRVPKEMVGTKQDLAQALRPKMDLMY